MAKPLTGKPMSTAPSLSYAPTPPTINPNFDPGNISLKGGKASPIISNYKPPAPAPIASAAPAPIPRPDTAVPITSDILGTPPVDYPDPIRTPNPLVSTVGTYTEMASSAGSTPAAPVGPKPRTTRDVVLERLLGISESARGKGDEESRLMAERDVAGKEEQVTKLNNEMSAAERAYTKRKREREKNLEGTFGGALNQDLATMEREYLSEQADRAILLEAANGNLSTANSIIQRQLDAKYKPLEDEAKNLERLFTVYQNDMSESEKVEAQAAIQEKRDQAEFGRQKDLASYKNELDKQLYGYKSGVDNPYGTSGANPVIDAKAAQYAATGTMPADTKGSEYAAVAARAKEMKKPTGTIVDRQTGIKSTAVGAAEQSDFSALYNIIQNTERLKQLDAQRADGLVVGTLGKLFGGSADGQIQAEYLSVRKAIIDDLARMQTGAALTKDEQEFYEDYLPGRYSEALFLGQKSENKISNFEKVMRNRMQDRSAAYGLAVYGFSTVKAPDGNEYVVGQEIQNSDGTTGTVLPDGSISIEDEGPVSFGGSLGPVASALVAQESGGDYGAIGIETDHGKALGKYQIIPKFHFDKIGLDPNSPEDQQKFLQTPQLQDKLFGALLTELNDTYQGDIVKVVAAYYGGDGAAQVVGTAAGNKPQKGGMPSINEYTRSVLSRAQTA